MTLLGPGHRRLVAALLVAVALLGTGCAADEPLTEPEAADILDEVLATFGAGADVAPSDFDPVVELLGDEGVWVNTGGVERDGTMLADFLASFTNIASIERVTEGVEYDDGWGFMTVETSSGGGEYRLGFVVSRDDAGALRIAEIRSTDFEALFDE